MSNYIIIPSGDLSLTIFVSHILSVKELNPGVEIKLSDGSVVSAPISYTETMAAIDKLNG